MEFFVAVCHHHKTKTTTKRIIINSKGFFSPTQKYNIGLLFTNNVSLINKIQQEQQQNVDKSIFYKSHSNYQNFSNMNSCPIVQTPSKY